MSALAPASEAFTSQLTGQPTDRGPTSLQAQRRPATPPPSMGLCPRLAGATPAITGVAKGTLTFLSPSKGLGDDAAACSAPRV